MILKDTPENYGTVAKWLHWTTAVFILASYCTVYYRHWFTEEKTLANWNARLFARPCSVHILQWLLQHLLYKKANALNA